MHQPSLAERIDHLTRLGDVLASETDEKAQMIRLAAQQNPWFSPPNSSKALQSISGSFLNGTKLHELAARYDFSTHRTSPLKLGVICAGNIPCVGFHDLLCGYLAGASIQLKLSEKDQVLMRWLVEKLHQIAPQTKESVQIVPRLSGFEAVIATGADSSGLYFEKYFGKYPHIIRKHRNSVAILDGTETEPELMRLGSDIFSYFGLGCRSVSKIYAPIGYDWQEFLRVLDNYQDIMQHTKYANNYEYNRAIYLLNKTPHLANNCLILLEDSNLLARIGCLHWEDYRDAQDLVGKLSENTEKIQAIVSKQPLKGFKIFGFGLAQSPDLEDFADGIDTIDFILKNS
jgi:hypothetical protein